MMTYVLVALGGAIGSVLRYALGVLSVAAWGNSFPWGTILINVTGSFLIGLVGAATVADGLLPASPALRILIMVGFCGGYTTFSSFSLQTLDLVRDGRVAAALLNVMLSVLLCFVAVAAGHYAAAGLGGRMLAMNATRLVREPVVLAVLERPECAPAQLAAALRLLEVFGPGRLDAMAIRAARREPAVPTEEVGGTVEAGALRLAEQDRTSSLKSAADRWAASAGAGPLIWSDPGGETGRLVGEAGRGADPIVLAHPPALRHQSGRAGLYAALFDAARPVLLLPADAVASFGDVIAVAWKNDVAARHAVLAALPLLQRAPRVVLLSDAGLTEPPLLFRDHAIAVDLRMFEGEEASLGERLLRAAHEARADLLVLGAFAHAPLHERVLGGVTRHVLDAANLPVFMQH